jgi:hypothetical protein
MIAGSERRFQCEDLRSISARLNRRPPTRSCNCRSPFPPMSWTQASVILSFASALATSLPRLWTRIFASATNAISGYQDHQGLDLARPTALRVRVSCFMSWPKMRRYCTVS